LSYSDLNVFNMGYITGWTPFKSPRWQSTSRQSTFLVGNRRVRHPVHMNPALTLLVSSAYIVSHEARNNLRSPRLPL
jgi:hypothetical protein